VAEEADADALRESDVEAEVYASPVAAKAEAGAVTGAGAGTGTRPDATADAEEGEVESKANTGSLTVAVASSNRVDAATTKQSAITGGNSSRSASHDEGMATPVTDKRRDVAAEEYGVIANKGETIGWTANPLSSSRRSSATSSVSTDKQKQQQPQIGKKNCRHSPPIIQ
jgi:hypothetical protein